MLIDVTAKSRLNNDDIIIFKNGHWETIHKGEFLAGVCHSMNHKEKVLKEENRALRDTIAKLEEKLDQTNTNFQHFQDSVNEKLESYHNVLQTLTGARKQ